MSSSFMKRDMSTSVISELNVGGYKITNIANPVDAQDAVSKSYMDGNDTMHDKRDGSSAITDDLNT
jgi:hypothetical protein